MHFFLEGTFSGKFLDCRGNFKSNSKDGKDGIAKNCKGEFEAAACRVTAENAPFRRAKRGRFDNFEEF